MCKELRVIIAIPYNIMYGLPKMHKLRTLFCPLQSGYFLLCVLLLIIRIPLQSGPIITRTPSPLQSGPIITRTPSPLQSGRIITRTPSPLQSGPIITRTPSPIRTYYYTLIRTLSSSVHIKGLLGVKFIPANVLPLRHLPK